MPNAMLIHHPPFSCTICPIGRTSIGVRGYTKNPKECKYKCQKEYSFIRNITCQHIQEVFFFSTHNYGQASLPLVYKLRNHTHF